MVRKNYVQSLEPEQMVGACCDRQPVAEPVVPPVVPVVSVKSVNGKTGKVVLENLTVGTKVYNGEHPVALELNDLVPGGDAVTYMGARTFEVLKDYDVKAGQMYLCSDRDEFWYGVGVSSVRKIPTEEFLAPYAKIREAANKMVFSLEEGTNKLSASLYDKNGQFISESNVIDLPFEQIIKEIKYDNTTKELIFVLAEGVEKKVYIGSITDGYQPLITEAKPLEAAKVQGLVEFENTTTTKLDNEITERKTAITNLTNKIEAEETARKADTLEVKGLIGAETTARETAVSEEKTAREEADTKEASLRDNADKVLQGNIDSEVVARTKYVDESIKPVSQAIEKEVSDRVSAIEKEVADRNTAIATAKSDVEAKLATEISERKEADTNLGKAVSDEAKARVEADAAEVVARNTAIEQSLNTAKGLIETEKSRAEGAEGTLNTKIDTQSTTLTGLISREEEARINADSGLTSRISAEETARQTAVAGEATLREQADVNLGNRITSESSALDTKITAVSTALSTESKTRADADTALDTKFGDLLEQANARIDSTNASLSKEVTDRGNADTALGGRIDKEVENRTNADTALGDRITEEANTRSSQVSQVAGNLTSEISRSTTEDARLSGLISANTSAITVEVSERKAAVKEVSDNLTTLTARVATEETTRATEDAKLQAQISAIHVADYTIEKLADPGVYASVYRLKKDSAYVGDPINVPKDQMLKSVEVKVCEQEGVPLADLHVGDKYLDFTFTTTSGEVHSYIALKDLVIPYTGDETTIHISNANVISVKEDVTNAIATNAENISKEVTARETSINTLNGTVIGEINRATAAEADLLKKINDSGASVKAHIEDKNNPHAVTKAQVGLGNCDNTSDIDKPVSTAQKAYVDAETTRATGVEATLNTNIETVATNLASEVTRSTNADTEHTNAINKINTETIPAEATQRYNDDQALQTQITQNKNDITQLNTDLTTERTERTNDVTTLTTRIATEESTRETNDEALDAKITKINTETIPEVKGLITAEETARKNADDALESSLTGKISAEETRATGVEGTLQSNITSEANTRASEDAKLQANIDKKVDSVIETASNGGKAIITNEADGGCIKFEGATNWSAVAANDGGAGIGAQMYNWKRSGSSFVEGTVLDVTQDKIYYYKGAYTAASNRDKVENEIATMKDVESSISVFSAEDVPVTEED